MAHGEYKAPLNSFLPTLHLRAPLLQAKMIIVGMTKELAGRRNIRNWRIVRARLGRTTYDVGTLTTSSECRTVKLGTVNIPIPGCL
jgi:hypothetical protein